MGENGNKTEHCRFVRIARLPKRWNVTCVFASANWSMAVGFALCQTWNVLCVSVPDPITYTDPFLDLRWVSLLTTLVLSVLAATCTTRAYKLLRNDRFVGVVGVISAIGSILGPVSVFASEASAIVLHVAAIAVGIGFSGLFLAWFDVFAEKRDTAGLAVSVVMAMVLTYPLANILSSDQMSPWVAALVASVLPILSVLLLTHGSNADESWPLAVSEAGSRGVGLLFRFCFCLLFVTTIVETVRNLLLGGEALSFYAGVVNLGVLVLKLASSAWLLAIFDMRNAEGVSTLYRAAFLLLLAAVLFIPYLLEGSWIAHALLELGSFFFQLTMVMVAYEICYGFHFRSMQVFGAARAAWALGVLAGIGLGRVGQMGGMEVVQALAVGFGLTAAFGIVFVFTDQDCVNLLSNSPLPSGAPRFRRQCESLVRRSGVSQREAEVLMLVAKGRSAGRIAEDLGVSLATVNSHVHHIYQKLGIHSRQELLDRIEAEFVAH